MDVPWDFANVSKPRPEIVSAPTKELVVIDAHVTPYFQPRIFIRIATTATTTPTNAYEALQTQKI